MRWKSNSFDTIDTKCVLNLLWDSTFTDLTYVIGILIVKWRLYCTLKSISINAPEFTKRLISKCCPWTVGTFVFLKAKLINNNNQHLSLKETITALERKGLTYLHAWSVFYVLETHSLVFGIQMFFNFVVGSQGERLTLQRNDGQQVWSKKPQSEKFCRGCSFITIHQIFTALWSSLISSW